MRIRSYRILSQFIFLFLSVIGIAGVAKTGLIFPFFFCNASPGAVCVCPIWALEHASIMMRIDFKTALAMLLFLFGFLGVIGFFVGRSFCGWACPIGFIQDIAKHFKKKVTLPMNMLFGLLIIGITMVASSFLFPNIATGYLGTVGVAVIALALYAILIELDNLFINISAVFFCAIILILIRLYFWDTPGIREIYFFTVLVQLFVGMLTIVHKYVITKQTTIHDTKFYHKNSYYKLKYVILILIPITSYLFMDKWFTNIDPIGGLTAGVPVLMYENEKWNVSFLLWIKFFLIALFFWLIFITNRGFCRFICPIGAMMSPLNKISLQDIKYYPENCTKCMKCIKQCPMRINVIKMNKDMECIRCGRCVDACKYDALHIVMANKVIK
jgi:polyferredoxin